MKVTILIPVYNVSLYITECAESLFAQTYKDIEYVFVDDCSPDNSIHNLEEVIGQHPERKDAITILRHERNKGLGGARRTAIEHFASVNEGADDAACMIVDSDDVLTPDAVKILVEKMQETGATVVDGAYAEYSNKQVSAPFPPYHGDEKSHQKKILCQNILSNRVWGRLYSLEAIKALSNPFIEGIDYSEDFCFIGRLCDSMHRAWTDSIVYLYRTDNMSSYTKQMSAKNMQSFLRANSVVYDYYRQHYDNVPTACEVGMLNAYRVLLANNAEAATADNVIGMKSQRVATKVIRYMLLHRLPLADLAYRLYRELVSK